MPRNRFLSIAVYLVLIWTTNAVAANAVLLTSLRLSPGKRAKIEALFQQAIRQTELEPVIIHAAKPENLYQHLRSEETTVLIWVSHAGGAKHVAPGLGAPARVLDVDGNDVRKFFSIPHPNIRYLGLVGCRAGQILDDYRVAGFYSSDLRTLGFSSKVELFKGLRQTLASVVHYYPTFSRANESRNDFLTTEQFTILRPPHTIASWVELGDTVLAFFPGGTTPQESRAQVPFPYWQLLSTHNLLHVQARGTSEMLPELAFTGPGPGMTWRPFQNATGVNLSGSHRVLYLYQGQIDPQPSI